MRQRFKEEHRPLGARLAERFQTRDKECFRNAAMVTVIAGADLGLTYVEGWAICYGIAMHHAWVEQAGNVIDVTPTWIQDDYERDALYFPAIRLNAEEVLEAINEKDLPRWLGYGRMPDELAVAYEAAGKEAYGEVWEKLGKIMAEVAA